MRKFLCKNCGKYFFRMGHLESHKKKIFKCSKVENINYKTYNKFRLRSNNKKYKNNEIELKIFEEMRIEIDLYKKFSDFYGYEFFIMQKI